MSRTPPIDERELYCWAGRWAFLSGAWDGIRPCMALPIHVIAAEGAAVPVRLCDDHFQQANAAGFVSEPYVDPDEFRRRRRKEGYG